MKRLLAVPLTICLCSAAFAADEVEARDALRAAIAGAARLSVADRRALALAAAECSNAEMAGALGVSAAAARTRLCRARAHLARTMSM